MECAFGLARVAVDAALRDGVRAAPNEGKKFASRLNGGEVIALVGELGTGKTVFTKGLCEGLNVKRKSVFVTGSQDDLKRLVRVKTIGGVYVQLLPQQ